MPWDRGTHIYIYCKIQLDSSTGLAGAVLKSKCNLIIWQLPLCIHARVWACSPMLFVWMWSSWKAVLLFPDLSWPPFCSHYIIKIFTICYNWVPLLTYKVSRLNSHGKYNIPCWSWIFYNFNVKNACFGSHSSNRNIYTKFAPFPLILACLA